MILQIPIVQVYGKAIWNTKQALSHIHIDFFFLNVYFLRKTVSGRKRSYLYYIIPKCAQERRFNVLSKDNLCCPLQHKGEGWGIIIVSIVQVGKWDEGSEKLKVTSKVCDRAGNRIEALYSKINTLIMSITISFTSFFPCTLSQWGTC